MTFVPIGSGAFTDYATGISTMVQQRNQVAMTEVKAVNQAPNPFLLDVGQMATSGVTSALTLSQQITLGMDQAAASPGQAAQAYQLNS